MGKMLSYTGFIAVNRDFGPIFKDLKVVTLLSQLAYWQNHATREDGWFYKTSEQLEYETMLSPYEQRHCRKILVKRGWIMEQFMGVPPKIYFHMGEEFYKFQAVQGKLAEEEADNCRTMSNLKETSRLRFKRLKGSTIYNTKSNTYTTTHKEKQARILAHIANHASCTDEKNAVLRVAEQSDIDMADFGKARIEDNDLPF